MWPFSKIEKLESDLRATMREVVKLQGEMRIPNRTRSHFIGSASAINALSTEVLTMKEVDDRLNELYAHLGVERVTTPSSTKLVKKTTPKP